jgi:hypothetical protein
MSRPTYDDNQINKPLKVCLRCKRSWWMLADVCAECVDAKEIRPGVWRANHSASIFATRFDVNGVEMTDP